jgi:biopolymer transport protein ExbD
MKFPRNAKILRSHFDVAPFAAVFFCLMIFLLLGALIPTAGIPLQSLQPPTAADLPGTDKPTVAMAVDAQGRLYYENQIVSERVLKTSLAAAVKGAREPLTLIIHADKAVSYEMIAHLSLLARDCCITNGITNAVLATLPRVGDVPVMP